MIDQIKQWFVKAVPEPTDKNRAVQIGCHFEEVAEMVDSLEYYSSCLKDCMYDLEFHYKSLENGVETNNPDIDKLELLDSLCDQIVTAIGVAHMFGMDIEGALAEVNRSNWSKFVDGKPQFDVNGKISKPVSYSKPDLKGFV